jgi:hypothetical protein
MKGQAMNEQTISDLESADPVGAGDDDGVRDAVLQMAYSARNRAGSERAKAVAPWWKRHHALLPISIATMAVLTGGAILIPLDLSVSGVSVEPDVEIPIVYTTDTGVEVSCREQFFFGEPGDRDDDDVRVAEFMRSHDWTGIGQQIYEEALANPIIPEADGGTEPQFDQASFSSATSRVIEAEIPVSLRAAWAEEGTLYSTVTDCTGELHR